MNKMTLDDLLGAIQSFDKNFNYRDFSGQDMRGLNDGLEGVTGIEDALGIDTAIPTVMTEAKG
jgi:hypothetical protein